MAEREGKGRLALAQICQNLDALSCETYESKFGRKYSALLHSRPGANEDGV